MPLRNQTFEDAGEQGKYSTQFKPSRLLANGLTTDPVELGLKENESAFDPLVDQGTAYMGYGTTTQGEYTVEKGGWKTFGSIGQGPILQGTKGLNQNDCENRQVFVTLYAKRDFEPTQEVEFSFATWQFNQPSSGPAVLPNRIQGNTNTIDWGAFPTFAAALKVSSLIITMGLAIQI